MNWPRERQTELYDRQARKAYRRALRYFKDHQEEIIEAGRGRMLGSGFDQYGETVFQKTYADLERDKLEEAADLVVYTVVEIGKGW